MKNECNKCFPYRQNESIDEVMNMVFDINSNIENKYVDCHISLLGSWEYYQLIDHLITIDSPQEAYITIIKEFKSRRNYVGTSIKRKRRIWPVLKKSCI